LDTPHLVFETEEETPSQLTLDERYFLSEDADGLSQEDFKKIRKCKIGLSKSECSVCFEVFKKNQVINILPCKHKFHYKCIKPWLKKSTCCPLCRMDLKKYFNPGLINSVNSVESESSERRNPLLDASFLQPRVLTPFRSLRPSVRRYIIEMHH
jgi:hypothetical protein